MRAILDVVEELVAGAPAAQSLNGSVGNLENLGKWVGLLPCQNSHQLSVYQYRISPIAARHNA